MKKKENLFICVSKSPTHTNNADADDDDEEQRTSIRLLIAKEE